MGIDSYMRYQLKRTLFTLQMKTSLAKYTDLGRENKNKDFIEKPNWIEQLNIDEEKFIETLEKAKKAHLLSHQMLKLKYSVYGNPVFIDIKTSNSKEPEATKEIGLGRMNSTAKFWESKGLLIDKKV